ncbi:N-acetylglucosamine kinase [Salmonirosea aquatica]|uniref:N-acetylglucosamine kinase n=1 Tax=Salmonirosea aquatica TaxID=2654236 RepID=A0A7C9F459_9BACT|nr:N-acetylglucosamine kinase [Cytophagaceae bacterium SJW1-29]
MILLADSGSTKTDWLLLGPEIIRFQSAGFNPFYQTQEVIAEILRREVLSHTESHRVEQIYFYGAGCADATTSLPVTNALTALFPTAGTIEVHSDLLAAARALCGRAAGIACILGTGANNGLYNGEKITHNIGSLGFWLGDEGSGGYLGKQLVIKYLHNELPSGLHEAFRASFPDVSRFIVLERAYRQPFPNRYFASFSPFLSQHLAEPFVRGLVGDAFRAFLATYVCKHPNASELPVHFTGSVAYHFREILAEVLIEKNLRLGTIQRSPMPGLLQFHQNASY